jgi:hypothetical protein
VTFFPRQHADGHRARKHRLAFHQHRARAALSETAAELCTVELEIRAKHVEQRRIGLGIDRDGASV